VPRLSAGLFSCIKLPTFHCQLPSLFIIFINFNLFFFFGWLRLRSASRDFAETGGWLRLRSASRGSAETDGWLRLRSASRDLAEKCSFIQLPVSFIAPQLSFEAPGD